MDEHTIMLAHMDSIIQNPKRLHSLTLLLPEQFDYLCHKIKLWMEGSERGRLFWDDENRKSDPGNRCRLYIRYLLLLSIAHKKGGYTEDELGALFLVGQNTVYKYLRLANAALADVLPTANNLTEIIRGVHNMMGLRKDTTEKVTPATPAATHTQVADGIPLVSTQPWEIFDSQTPLVSMHQPARTMIGQPAAPDGNGAVPGFRRGPELSFAVPPDTRATVLLDGMHVPVLRSEDPRHDP